jgi:hypothetical protein
MREEPKPNIGPQYYGHSPYPYFQQPWGPSPYPSNPLMIPTNYPSGFPPMPNYSYPGFIPAPTMNLQPQHQANSGNTSPLINNPTSDPNLIGIITSLKESMEKQTHLFIQSQDQLKNIVSAIFVQTKKGKGKKEESTIEVEENTNEHIPSSDQVQVRTQANPQKKSTRTTKKGKKKYIIIIYSYT